MNHTEHNAKTTSPRTGLSATLRGLRRSAKGTGGTGAPSSGRFGARTASLRLIGLLALTTAALLTLSAAPAFAQQTHVLKSSFGEPGSGPGQLALQASNFSVNPRVPGSGIAVNQTSHDLYVADTGNGRVAEFEANGTFVRGFGTLTEPTFIAVDNSSGASKEDVYVADSATGTVSKFEADGTPVTGWGTAGVIAGFTELKGIAVGAGGDLFVLDESQTLHRYEADGTPVGSPVAAERGSFPGGLAIDTEGNLYKVNGEGTVNKFGPAGEGLSFILDARTDSGGLGIDPSNNDLYVIQSNGKAPFVNRFAVNCGEECPPLESFEAEELSAPQGIAIEAATHTAYLTNATTSAIDVFAPATVPDVTIGSAAVHGLTATASGEVNPAGIALTECAFEYVTQAAFEATGFSNLSSGGSTACEAPEAGEIPADEAFHPVHAELEGLTPNTVYRFRLTAANSQGPSHSQSLTLTSFGRPGVDVTSVSEVSATAATLEAELNPHGLATTYHFEYDTTPYAEGEALHGTATPTGSAGSGTSDVSRTAQTQGLLAGTIYHFRVLATNSLGTVEGPDRTFTTQPATASSLLPDNRGWELVSPPDKQGVPLAPISREGGLIQAAADGHAIAYFGKGSIVSEPAGDRSSVNSQDLSTRTASGWSTADITTPHQAPVGVAPGFESEYQLFSTDLSLGAVEPFGATPLSPQATEKTPYLRQSDGTYNPLVTESNVPPGIAFGGTELAPEEFGGNVRFVTATPDLSHVLVESPTSLVEGFETGGGQGIYEWSQGALTPVSWVPPGTETLCGGSATACEPSGGAAGSNSLNRQLRNAISADGSRVFFTGSSLYLHDLPRGESLLLDAPQGGSGESGRATFQDASTDGSRVFFTDEEKLTADSGAAHEIPDLYMCQIEETPGGLACDLTDLSANAINPAEPAGVRGAVIGAADDGSSVYFVANGALTAGEGAVPGNCVLSGGVGTGECNLYRYDTETSSLSLVAVLSGADYPDWAPEGGLEFLTARVSPSGNWLAFMSERPLTGYDNRDAVSGERDEEVVLYDAGAEGGNGKLHCASCNPTGARPAGRQGPPNVPYALVDGAPNWENRWYAANVPGWTNIDNLHALYQSRYLSDSGRLFFNAADALVPQDTNGTEDVYQYEPPGVGSCSEASAVFAPRNGGCVDLISSGTSGQESAFMDADEKGENVFFLTASRLTAKDEDKALDLYDARVGGGEAPPVKPVECSGDACQQPAVPPNFRNSRHLSNRGSRKRQGMPQGQGQEIR